MTKLRPEDDDQHNPQPQQHQQQQQQQQQLQERLKDPTRSHQIYVIFHRQLKKRVRDGAAAAASGLSASANTVRIHYIQTTEVAGLSHDKLYGIHVLLLLKRILQLASENGDALDFDHLAHSVHNALFFSMEQGFKPITPPRGTDPSIWSLDKSVQLVLTQNGELPLQQKCTECFSIVDLRRIENPGYAIINPFNEGRRVDVAMGVPLSAASYAKVYEDEDKKLFWKDYQTEIDAVLGFFKKQRLLRTSEIRTFWPRVVCSGAEDEEAAILDQPKTKSKMEKLQDMASQVFVSLFASSAATAALTASERREWTLDRLPPRLRFRCFETLSKLRLITDVDLENWARFCGEGAAVASAAAAPIPSVAVTSSGGGKLVAWDELEKSIVENICLSRCLAISRSAFLDMVSVGGKFLKEIDVSWTDIVNDDVINNLVISCPNLHLLKANGCKNINGSNLRHEALIHLDAAHNLDGIHMDIYIFYKSFRHNGKIVMGKLRHSWLYGRAALHFTLRILKFCYFHKLAHVDEYESYEGLLQRYLFVDPAMPYYHRNIEIIHENLYPSPFKHAAAYESRRLRPRVCNGPVPLAPTGYPALVIDMTGIQPNQYPYFSFVSRPWGQPESLHALSPEQYLNIFYPEGGVYSEMSNYPIMEKDIKRLLKEFRLQRHRLESHSIMRVYDSFLKGEKDIFDKSRSPSPQIAFLEHEDEVSADRERSESVPKAVLDSRLDPGERGFKHPSSIPLSIPTVKQEKPELDLPERGRLSRPVIGSPDCANFSSDEEDELNQESLNQFDCDNSSSNENGKPRWTFKELPVNDDDYCEEPEMHKYNAFGESEEDEDEFGSEGTPPDGVGAIQWQGFPEPKRYAEDLNYENLAVELESVPVVDEQDDLGVPVRVNKWTQQVVNYDAIYNSLNHDEEEDCATAITAEETKEVRVSKWDQYTINYDSLYNTGCEVEEEDNEEEEEPKQLSKWAPQTVNYDALYDLSDDEKEGENKEMDEDKDQRDEKSVNKWAPQIVNYDALYDQSDEEKEGVIEDEKEGDDEEEQTNANKWVQQTVNYDALYNQGDEDMEEETVKEENEEQEQEEPKGINIWAQQTVNYDALYSQGDEEMEEKKEKDEEEENEVKNANRWCQQTVNYDAIYDHCDEIEIANEEFEEEKDDEESSETKNWTQQSVNDDVPYIKSEDEVKPLEDADEKEIQEKKENRWAQYSVNYDALYDQSNEEEEECKNESEVESETEKENKWANNDMNYDALYNHSEEEAKEDGESPISDLEAGEDVNNKNKETDEEVVIEDEEENPIRANKWGQNLFNYDALYDHTNEEVVEEVVDDAEKEELGENDDQNQINRWAQNNVDYDESNEELNTTLEDVEDDENDDKKLGTGSKWAQLTVNYDALYEESNEEAQEEVKEGEDKNEDENEEEQQEKKKWAQFTVNYDALYDQSDEDGKETELMEGESLDEGEKFRVKKEGDDLQDGSTEKGVVNLEEHEGEQLSNDVLSVSYDNVSNVTQTSKFNEDDEGYQTEASCRSGPGKNSNIKRVVIGEKAPSDSQNSSQFEQTDDMNEKMLLELLKGMKTSEKADLVNYIQKSKASPEIEGPEPNPFENSIAGEISHQPNELISDNDEKESDTKQSKWGQFQSINYDALYEDQVEDTVAEPEIQSLDQSEDNDKGKEGGEGYEVEKKGENVEAEQKPMNRWAQYSVNYDALYDHSDEDTGEELKEEEKELDKETEKGNNLNQFEPEETERKKKWAQLTVNYDALYDQSDEEAVQEVKNEEGESDEKVKQEVVEEAAEENDDKEQEEEEEPSRKNKWAHFTVNYDALYVQSDEEAVEKEGEGQNFVEAKQEVVESDETPETSDEKEPLEEDEQNRNNKWAQLTINYDALYVQSNEEAVDEVENGGNWQCVEEAKQEVVEGDEVLERNDDKEQLEEEEQKHEEAKEAVKVETVDGEPEINDGNETVDQEEPRKNRWEQLTINYNALYDASDEEVGEEVEMEEEGYDELESKDEYEEKVQPTKENVKAAEDTGKLEVEVRGEGEEVENNKDEKEYREQEESERKNKWAQFTVNYDALYDQSDEDAGQEVNDNEDICDNVKKNDDDREKEGNMQEKPNKENKWPQLTINYDNLHDQSDEDMEKMVNEGKEQGDTEDNKNDDEDIEKSESDRRNKWAKLTVNYDALYDQSDEDMGDEVEDKEIEEEKEVEDDVQEKGESAQNDQIDEEAKKEVKTKTEDSENAEKTDKNIKEDEKLVREKKWAQLTVNYDALYDQCDEEVKEDVNQNGEEVENTGEDPEQQQIPEKQSKWTALTVNYEALYDQSDEEMEENLEMEGEKKDFNEEKLEDLSNKVQGQELVVKDEGEEEVEHHLKTSHDINDINSEVEPNSKSEQMITEETIGSTKEDDVGSKPNSKWGAYQPINYDALYDDDDQDDDFHVEHKTGDILEKSDINNCEEEQEKPSEGAQSSASCDETPSSIEAEDTETKANSRWGAYQAINYDALYDDQEDSVPAIDKETSNIEITEQGNDQFDEKHELSNKVVETDVINNCEEKQEKSSEAAQSSASWDETPSSIEVTQTKANSRWGAYQAINYDALYDDQKDSVLSFDHEASAIEQEQFDEKQELLSINETGVKTDMLVQSEQVLLQASESSKETVPNKDDNDSTEIKVTNRWGAYQAINYDALYDSNEAAIEEDRPNDVDGDMSPNENKVENKKEDHSKIEELPVNEGIDENVAKSSNKWKAYQTNYDALYDDHETENVLEEPIAELAENEVEKDDGHSESKPRWEVNYDALYVVEDDTIGENDEVMVEQQTTESDVETLGLNQLDSDNNTTSDTDVESLRSVIMNRTSELRGKDSESSCNEDDVPTPKNIPLSPPKESFIVEPTPSIPSNTQSRQMKKYGRRDTETINASQKQKTDMLLETVQEKLLAAVQEEEEISSSQDSSNEEKDDSQRRSRESKAPERDILFGELKSMSSGDLSPIVEDEDEEEIVNGNDLSKLKTLIPGIAEIAPPGIMSPIPVCGANSQEKTSWGEWMDKFIPSYGNSKADEEEIEADDEDDKYERDSEISELDSVYSEFDSEYVSDDEDVIEYESYQEIEDNLFVMQAVKQQRPWADVDERDTLKILRNANGNKQETILQLIELDKERCKLLGLE